MQNEKPKLIVGMCYTPTISTSMANDSKLQHNETKLIKILHIGEIQVKYKAIDGKKILCGSSSREEKNKGIGYFDIGCPYHKNLIPATKAEKILYGVKNVK